MACGSRASTAKYHRKYQSGCGCALISEGSGGLSSLAGPASQAKSKTAKRNSRKRRKTSFDNREANKPKMLIRKKRERHLGRYREIAVILARHGLGWLALELNLGGLIPFHWGLLKHPKSPQKGHVQTGYRSLHSAFL